MKFYLFDFDRTLYNSLDSNQLAIRGINTYENSLPLNRKPILNEKWNESVINFFRFLKEDESFEKKIFLVTARSDAEQSRKTVINFLDKRNLFFDDYYFGYDQSYGESSKVDAMIQIVNKHGLPAEVHFLDDQIYFLNGFLIYKQNNPRIPIKICLYKIVNGQITKYPEQY